MNASDYNILGKQAVPGFSGTAQQRANDIRSRIANGCLIGLSLVVLPALAISLYRSVEIGWQPIMGVHIALAACVLGVTLYRRRLPYRLRGGFIVAFFSLLGVAGYMSFGLVSGGPVFFLGAGVLAFLLISTLAGIFVSLATVITHGAIFFLFDAGLLPVYSGLGAYALSISAWSAIGASLLLLHVAIGASVSVFSVHLTTALEHEAEERRSLHDLIVSVPDGILLVNSQGKICETNPQLEDMFGYEPGELKGQPVERLIPHAYRSRHAEYVSEYAAHGTPKTMGADRSDLVGLRKDGSEFPAYITLAPFSGTEDQMSVAVVRDLTERQVLENQLLQAQKMEAVGQLTGGVAHDFNNLLAVILGNAELLEDKIGDDPQLATISRAGTRGAELTQRLLAFSRRQTLVPQSIDLLELVSGFHDLFRSTLGETVNVVTDIPEAIWPVVADLGQLESALLNLSINARDAMPNGGILEIRCSNIELQEGDPRVSNDVLAGDYVRITVRDTGTGMPDGVVEHVFEPFYTTKDVGEGSGLGLSMVYGFARQSGGDVAIESSPDTGTEVTIFLPRSGVTATSDELTQEGDLNRGQGEVILVLEDDPDVRTLAVAILSGLGYRVLEAGDAHAAMLVLEEETDKLNLLLSDVVLPGGVSGPDFAIKAKDLYPNLKIVFMTGYASGLDVTDNIPDISDALLFKPFKRADLATVIHDALVA